ncbi:hypothetical protein J6590_037765 [Homalodisca vitripennis]|nr:hypothetical protein J6590_037765 [Homalodisca vitripennis]
MTTVVVPPGACGGVKGTSSSRSHKVDTGRTGPHTHSLLLARLSHSETAVGAAIRLRRCSFVHG